MARSIVLQSDRTGYTPEQQMSDQHPPDRPQLEDYQHALQSMGTFIDVSVDDLMTMARRAEQFASQRAGEAIAVQRIMKQPVHTVRTDTPLSEAAHLMVSERISGLPVVDDAGQLVGIITEADFLRALGVPAHHPSHTLWQTLESLFSHLIQHPHSETPDDRVEQFMVREVVTTTPDKGLGEVIGLMKQHHVKRIVVCDEHGHVVGMVTRSDLVRVFFDRYTDSAKVRRLPESAEQRASS